LALLKEWLFKRHGVGKMMTKTETYVRGMEAINNFYCMLYAAMLKSMPEAIISASGAYVWRGYRIDKYQDLTSGHYYCQIYPQDTKKLLFQEGYLDPTRQVSQFEKDYQIQQGQYYYPFSESLDLVHSRFFDFDKNDQFMLLEKFIIYAAEKACHWQNSDARNKGEGEPNQKGRRPRFVPVRKQGTFGRVSIEFLQAWEDQTQVLKNIKKILCKDFPNHEWIRPNASIHNFWFRGMRLKLPGETETSRWEIHFDDFGKVKFRIPKGRRNIFDLVENGFFDLSTPEQTKQLQQFIHASMDKNA
jgi:hypothetical protein